MVQGTGGSGAFSAERRGRLPAIMVTAVAVAMTGLLLAGCGTAPSPQRVAISRALVTADGRHVVVPVTLGDCVRRSALTATGTASRVTLVLTQFRPDGTCTVQAAAAMGTTSVALRYPLAGRVLIDGTTGRPISYFDERKLLRVTYLPPGYRLSHYWPNASGFWFREYTSVSGKDQRLTVLQIPGHAAGPSGWPVQSRVMVPGQAATLQAAGHGPMYSREITWSAGGFVFSISTTSMNSGQLSLPAAELIRIADGLRP